MLGANYFGQAYLGQGPATGTAPVAPTSLIWQLHAFYLDIRTEAQT